MKSNGYFTLRPMNFHDNISLKFFLESEIFWTKVVEKIKTNIFSLRGHAVAHSVEAQRYEP